MRRRHNYDGAIAFAAVVLALTLSIPAVADDAPVVPVPGGGVVPYHEITIRLVSEEISIYLERDRYHVDVAYIFENNGPATDITMGFPNETDWMYGISISDFQAWVDGEEQEIYRRVYQEPDKPWGPESAPDLYYECFDTSFAAGETRSIHNSYSQEYAYGYDRAGRTAKYILTTGAFWADRIDEIDVAIFYRQHDEDLAPRMLYLDPDEVDEPWFVPGPQVTPRPTGTFAEGDRIVLTDIEPDEDIEISLPMPMVEWVTADSELESARYDYGPKNVLDDDPATSWVEGEPGTGAGSTISLDLTSQAAGGKIVGAYEIQAIGMINGYAANRRLFEENNRVRTATLEWSSPLPDVLSSGTVTWNLADTMKMQYFHFPEPIPMSRVSVTIEDVYPGTNYDDTCIAEIVVVPVPPGR